MITCTVLCTIVLCGIRVTVFPQTAELDGYTFESFKDDPQSFKALKLSKIVIKVRVYAQPNQCSYKPWVVKEHISQDLGSLGL